VIVSRSSAWVVARRVERGAVERHAQQLQRLTVQYQRDRPANAAGLREQARRVLTSV